MKTYKTIVNYVLNNNPSLKKDQQMEKIKIRRIFDSLGMISFLSFLEKEFSITINDDDVTSRNFNNIETVVRLVDQKKQGKD